MPGDAAVHLALASTYAENQAWPKAVASYGAAIRADAAAREDARLIGDVVEALGSRDAHRQAEKLILAELRDTAGPRLDEASRSTNRKLRDRARKLRTKLARLR